MGRLERPSLSIIMNHELLVLYQYGLRNIQSDRRRFQEQDFSPNIGQHVCFSYLLVEHLNEQVIQAQLAKWVRINKL